MVLSKTDRIFIVSSSLVTLGLIFGILKWDFSYIDPFQHIKAIYVILLIAAYSFALYFVLRSRK